MRDESGRVAARVRDLLAEQRGVAAPASAVEVDAAVLSGSPVAPEPASLASVPVPTSGRAPLVSLWQRLLARVPMRLDPGRRAAIAVGVAVLVAALATGAWVLSQRPKALALSATPSVSGAVSPSGAGGSKPAGSGSMALNGPAPTPDGSVASSPAEVVVDVAGKVRHPGLHRLPPGSRVDDAVRAAGGALPGVNLNSLNLAAKVVDGQQIAVGVPPAPGAGGAAAGSGAGASGGGSPGGNVGPVDLNTATPEQLEALPGVGPVLAQNILDWRAAHGRFNSVDQLTDVTGIGPAKFATLRPLVTT